MKHISLAARYRPQAFAEVVGQNLATNALSRAAAENRVAPAYLLSGTRGVGKTTIARIFAKALNCEHAPGPEPCNQCAQCQQITAGNHVDVCEIDGASNTGVDDVRALRENVGYMPMQGRYKIFIMDEAHMLSKSAFNALLKTLEEPPGHTVFIFATTEAHRFPATIVSRCQHFVFRHLSEDMIDGHLAAILGKENIDFDPAAVRLIARRAAGSVRDSLSLLDQTLALARGRLDADTVRQSLGLAGQEFFDQLFNAFPARDCAKVVALCGELLHSGADIGFFIRELAGMWRNLFLYRQEGDKILPCLEVAPDEVAFLQKVAPRFGLTHLHAAWQMTLDNQRTIAQNPEPGPALELLLLNLAMLPQLVPVGNAPLVAGTPQETPPAVARPEHAPAAATEAKEYEAPSGRENWQMEESAAPQPGVAGQASVEGDRWQQFVDFCKRENDAGRESIPGDILRHIRAEWTDAGLNIICSNTSLAERFAKKKPLFERSLKRFCGKNLPHIIYAETPRPKSDKELMRECDENPGIQLCREILGANVVECKPVK